MKFNLSILALLFCMTFWACQSDSTPKAKVESDNTEVKAETTTSTQEIAEQPNANTSVQAKSNTQDDHDHNNDKPKLIENNTRVSVPVKKDDWAGKKMPEYNEPAAMPKSKSKSQLQAEFSQNMQRAVIKLPSACDLASDQFIAKTIGVDAAAVTLKDGSNRSAPYARSCFFRWDHEGIPNSGVLIQIQSNPVPNDFPDWATYYISAKKNQGEKSPDGSMSFRYKDFAGVGVDGAYNYDLHRYTWRDSKDYVYLVAFNLPSDEATELEWAKKIGKEVMKNAKF